MNIQRASQEGEPLTQKSPKNSFVFFDMDGVIVNSEHHWRQVSKEHIQKIVPEWNDHWQNQIHGISVGDLLTLLNKEFGVVISIEEFLQHYKALAEEIYLNRSELIPGVSEVLTELKNRKIQMALVSAAPKSWMEMVISRYDLSKYFLAIIGPEDVGGALKPKPDGYLKALADLGASADQTVVIEDSEKGIQSAKNANLKCAGLRNSYNETQDFSLVDITLDGFCKKTVELILNC